MPVYNAEPFLASAVESVLGQTFTDFELLAVDDGSTDGSLALLRTFHDPRLRIEARGHAGVVGTMRAALDLCRGELVARADADDLCLPDRLALQVEFCTAHPDVAVLGGSMRTGSRVFTYPADPLRIRWTALYQSPFANTTLMFRRRAALAVGGYSSDYVDVDDYPFVSAMIVRYDGANLPYVLVVQRVNPDGISETRGEAQRGEGDRVRRANLGLLVDDAHAVDDLFYLLVGGSRRAGFDPGRIPTLLDGLIGGFRERWTVDDGRWRALGPWIGREIFERALGHGRQAPRVLVRMVAYACRLDPTLGLRPRFARGIARHLVLARVRG